MIDTQNMSSMEILELKFKKLIGIKAKSGYMNEKVINDLVENTLIPLVKDEKKTLSIYTHHLKGCIDLNAIDGCSCGLDEAIGDIE